VISCKLLYDFGLALSVLPNLVRFLYLHCLPQYPLSTQGLICSYFCETSLRISENSNSRSSIMVPATTVVCLILKDNL